MCRSDGAQKHGYVPSSVYRTRTQYRMQRFPTLSVHAQQQQAHSLLPASGGGLPSHCINAACCSDARSCRDDERYTYQASDASRHPLAASNSSDDGLRHRDEVSVTPCVASDHNAELSSDGGHWSQFDQSRCVSSSYSHAATSQLVSRSRDGRGLISQTMSSNFYSTSTHYSVEPSRLTECPLPHGPSTVSSHSVSNTVQHRQNVIQVSKPFESSDVLRYSEKLRRQRLNNCVAAPSEFL